MPPGSGASTEDDTPNAVSTEDEASTQNEASIPDAASTPNPASTPPSADVAIVGGGPAGASAAVFTARYGLETVVFDSGPSSLRRCAYLANFLGFPAGLDIETFHDLAHAHVREAGARIHDERVESIERPDGDDAGAAFELELHDGTTHEAEAVIAATRSGAEYLRPLVGDAAFEEHEYDGEVHEHFDHDFPDEDGRTPIDGLYVASPAGERDVQALVAAGQGAHVARRLLADRRRERGYPEGLDEVYDWLRPDSEFAGEWGERDGWRTWFESRLPEDAALDDPVGDDVAASDAEDEDAPETLRDLRETYVDDALATRRSPESIEQLSERGLERFVAVFGADRLLAAMGAEEIQAHLADRTGAGPEVPPDG